MSELATLARPYAEAVFKRAKETGSLAEWSDTLAFLAAVMEDKELAAASVNPKVDTDRFRDLLLDICEGHISDEGKNLVKLLVDNGRLNLIKAISRLFEALKAEHEGYVDVEVKTAFAPSDEDRAKFTSVLERTLHRTARLHIEVDDALIGGFVARAGDKVIDGSVKGMLRQLARRL